jgi:hypothetical protein
MQISVHTPAIASPSGPRDYDGRIIFGYAVFATLVLTAIYLAAGATYVSDADFAMAMMFR